MHELAQMMLFGAHCADRTKSDLSTDTPDQKKEGIKMKNLVKLIVVAALIFTFSPYSLASKSVPANTDTTLQAPALQQDRFAFKHIPKPRSADNPADIGRSGKWGQDMPGEGSSLNDWLPLDSSGIWLLPYYR